VQTALLRQVPPSRHAAADATRIVPAVGAVGERPPWARLPEQAQRSQPWRGDPMEPDVEPGARDRRRVLLMVAVAVMVLVVIGSTWWVTLGRYTEAPAMVNMTKAQAELYAQQNHFELFYGTGGYSETVPKDTVLSQKPLPGEKIIKGGTVTLSLSLGKERFGVPDIVGQELSAAKGELAAANLKFKQGKGQYSDTVPEGSVISIDPKANTELKRGDTVTVVVSLGRAPITVPVLTGKNINDVRNELQQLGLTAVERYKDSDQPADIVIAQSPKAGAGVAKDDEVTLDVSKGPPLVTIPDVTQQPCPQAQAALQQANLQVQIAGNPNGFVVGMNPGGNSQAPAQTVVTLQCL